MGSKAYMHGWLHHCLNVIPFLNEHFLRHEWWKESKEDILTLSHDFHSKNKRFDSLTEFPDIPHIGQSLAWQNSQHFATILLVSPRNDVWETTAEIPYCFRGHFAAKLLMVLQNVGRLLRLVIFLYHFLTLFFVNPTCQCLNKATMKESWVSCGTDNYAVQGGHACCFCSSES